MVDKFLRFFFACGMGMGQMYLGYMKRGASLMLMAVIVVQTAALFYYEEILMFLFVIWAFSFFDTFRLARGDSRLQDAWLLDLKTVQKQNWYGELKKRPDIWGWTLIAAGIYTVYNHLVMPVLSRMAHEWQQYWLGSLLYSVPTLLLAALLVGLGIFVLHTKEKAPSSKAPNDALQSLFMEEAASVEAQTVPNEHTDVKSE